MKYNELPEEMQEKFVGKIPCMKIIISIIWIIIFSIISIAFLVKGHSFKYLAIFSGIFVLVGLFKLLKEVLNPKASIEKEKQWLQKNAEFTKKVRTDNSGKKAFCKRQS